MRNRRILIGLVAVLFSFPVIAQDSLTSVKDIKKQARTESADTLSGIWSQNWILKLKPHNGGYQLDTVSVLYEKYFGVLNYLNDPATPERYIAYNPDYYRLFVPTTYYYAPMERLSQVNWTFQKQDTVPAMTKELLPFDTLSFLSKENANRVVDRVMMNTYVNRPDLVEMTEKEIKKTKVFKDNIEKEVSSKPSDAKLFAQPVETVHYKLRKTISLTIGIKVVKVLMLCLPIYNCLPIIMIRKKYNGRIYWMLN